MTRIEAIFHVLGVAISDTAHLAKVVSLRTPGMFNEQAHFMYNLMGFIFKLVLLNLTVYTAM